MLVQFSWVELRRSVRTVTVDWLQMKVRALCWWRHRRTTLPLLTSTPITFAYVAASTLICYSTQRLFVLESRCYFQACIWLHEWTNEFYLSATQNTQTKYREQIHAYRKTWRMPFEKR